MSKVLQADDDQLKTALQQQVRHSEVQNSVIQDLSSKVGLAGKLIEDITKAAHSPRRTDESARKEIKSLLAKFNTQGARGAAKGKRG